MLPPLLERAIRAGRLEPGLFEEVGTDSRATGQAALVVLLSSLAAGIGRLPESGAGGLVWGLAAALAGWALWAWLIWLIGVRLLPPGTPRPEASPHPATRSGLLRALGFSSAPGVLRLLGAVPGLGWLVFFAASTWMLAAAVVAVRQVLGYRSTWRAAAVSLTGWIVHSLIMALLLALLGARVVA